MENAGRTSRSRSQEEGNDIKRHIGQMTALLEQQLRREARTTLRHSIVDRAAARESSKTAVLAQRLLHQGPRLSTSLDWVGSQTNRSAVAALLVGDLFLARYAGNFFAKSFIPCKRDHVLDATSLSIEPSRVCIHCWHSQRQIILESEAHVVFECPRYRVARERFFRDISTQTSALLNCNVHNGTKLNVLLSSSIADDWAALGSFIARIRQARRKMRQSFEAMSQRFARTSYTTQKAAWRTSGGYVCRHGVFFTARLGCPCLTPRPVDPAAWAAARKMPGLCHDLKAIIAVPFKIEECERLGVLQAKAKRMDY